MHKDKKGNVSASLTEVKNKTGDIFALVDEFGEVFITSYNKTRYKISKMDISSMLSEKSEDDAKPEREIKAKTVKAAPKVEAKKEEPKKVEKTEPEHKTLGIVAYDRNNSNEAAFTKKALQPLVNN